MGHKPLGTSARTTQEAYEAQIREAERELEYEATDYRTPPRRFGVGDVPRAPSTKPDPVAEAVGELAGSIERMVRVQHQANNILLEHNRRVGILLDEFFVDLKVANIKAAEWERLYRELKAERDG